MKNFLIACALFTLGLPLHTMQPITRITRFSTPLAPRAIRSLHTHDLRGTHRLGAHSPALGAYFLASQDVLQAYQLQDDPLGTLTKLFFYQNPTNNQLHITQYNKYLVRAVPPTVIAQLLQAKSPEYPLKNEEALISQWHQRYLTFADHVNTPITDKKNFTKKVKRFLTEFRTTAKDIHPPQVSSLLLAVAYKTAAHKKDLHEFAQSFSVELPNESYNHKDFEHLEERFQKERIQQEDISPEILEKMIYWFLKKEQSISHFLLMPPMSASYKGSPVRPLCADGTLRTLINMLFYNPDTQILDLSVLPESVQKTCNPQLQDFIKKHTYPLSSPQYYENSLADWLAVISEIPGIRYKTGNFEIISNRDNNLHLLHYLFGFKDKPSYEEIGKRLSTSNRTITLTPTTANNEQNSSLSVKVVQFTTEQSNFTLEAMAHFRTGSAHIIFKEAYFPQEAMVNGSTLALSVRKGPLTLRAYNLADLEKISLPKFEKLVTDTDTLSDQIFIKRVLATNRSDLIAALYKAGFDAPNNFISLLIEDKKHSLLKSLLAHIPFSPDHSSLRQALDHLDPVSVKLLIDAKVNLGKTIIQHDRKITPLLYVIGQLTGLPTLYNKKIDLKLLPILELLIPISPHLDDEDFYGKTPLIYALSNPDLTKQLLTAGANPSLKDRHRYTALHYACNRNIPLESFAALLDSGKCDLNASTGKYTTLDLVKNNPVKRGLLNQAAKKAGITLTGRQSVTLKEKAYDSLISFLNR